MRVDPAEAKTDIYVGLEHLDPESLHLKKWGHPSDVTGQKLVFKKGDVIFGRRRAYQRKLAVADFDGICSAHAMVVRAKPMMILPEFLPFFLQSDMFMERAIGISVGSLSPTINWRTLKVQEFPLPPIEEQKRIAEILWAVDEVLERWRVAKESVHSACQSSLLNYLQAKNDTATIEEMGVQIIDGDRGPNYPKASEYLDEHDGHCLFLSAKNVTKDGFSFSRNQFVSESKDNLLRKGRLKRNDLVLTTRGTVGNVAFYDNLVPYDHVRINSGMVILRCDSSKISAQLLYLILRSAHVQRQLVRKSYGSAQPQLSVSVIQKCDIPMLDEAGDEFLTKLLSNQDRLTREIQHYLSRTSSLLGQLQSMVFGGVQHV